MMTRIATVLALSTALLIAGTSPAWAPWSGGTFNRTDGTRTGATVWQDAAAAGVGIVAADADTHDQDIADGMEALLKRDGTNVMTGTLDTDGNDVDMGLGDILEAGSIAVRSVATGVLLTLESEDAGSGTAPVLDIFRDSASPVADDNLGAVKWNGDDDGNSKSPYAEIVGKIADPAAGSEEGEILLRPTVAGSLTTVATVSDDGITGALETGITTVATTSGTTASVTGIRSDVARITVVLNGVSTDGTSNLELTLGDSGGIETAGYAARATRLVAGTPPNMNGTMEASVTDAFTLSTSVTASDTNSSTIVLHHVGSNVWILSGDGLQGGTAAHYQMSGTKTLSGTLTQLQLGSASGDTFDAGSMSVFVE